MIPLELLNRSSSHLTRREIWTSTICVSCLQARINSRVHRRATRYSRSLITSRESWQGQNRYICPALAGCWASVADAGPTPSQHWTNDTLGILSLIFCANGPGGRVTPSVLRQNKTLQKQLAGSRSRSGHYLLPLRARRDLDGTWTRCAEWPLVHWPAPTACWVTGMIISPWQHFLTRVIKIDIFNLNTLERALVII